MDIPFAATYMHTYVQKVRLFGCPAPKPGSLRFDEKNNTKCQQCQIRAADYEKVTNKYPSSCKVPMLSAPLDEKRSGRMPDKEGQA